MSTDNPESIEPSSSKAGTFCVIFTIPLKNLQRFGNERSLLEIHDHLVNEIVHEEITLESETSGNWINNKIKAIKYS